MTRFAVVLLVLVTGCGSAGRSAPTPPQPASDADLVTATADCPAPCNVLGRVELPSGDTFAVLVSEGPEGGAKYVLARGSRVLDALPTEGLDDLTPDRPVTDRTGNVLVTVHGNTASAVHPFREVDGHLTLTQGSIEAPEMSGDNNTAARLVNGDLQVDVGDHELAENDVRTATTTWTWDGSAYREGPCINDQGLTGGPPC